MSSVAPILTQKVSMVDIRNWVSTILLEENSANVNWSLVEKLSIGLTKAIQRIDNSSVPAIVEYFADDWKLRRADKKYGAYQKSVIEVWVSSDN